VERWCADGAIRIRGPASPSRQDYFSATGTRAGAVWSRCFAVLLCAHRSTLYFRTLAVTGGALCAVRWSALFNSFILLGRGVRVQKIGVWASKWRVFRFWGSFWGDFGDFGTRNRHFFSFFAVASSLREGVGVLGITPHLLNVTGQGTRHLVEGTLDPLVGGLPF